MINLNGNIVSNTTVISVENRGHKVGDALFETIKVVHGKILFLEDHYFRLMASMRILRMEIPMNFTLEFLEAEILKTTKANQLDKSSVRVRITIDRGEGGAYLPIDQNINYTIVAQPLETDFYTLTDNATYVVDLFKDYFVAPGLLSTLKTNNKVINVLGSIYANENSLDNCLMLNTNKNVIEALNGNLFLVNGKTIKTPPLTDGCLKGIMRQQLMVILEQSEDYILEEASISPFELQKADELFITNVVIGIQPIYKYRKKAYTSEVSKQLVQLLNAKIRLA
ncbi:aminotransferase class IV [uncultured Psychroserpens sp.]|uniref:aminotransferase class IV n=1 Tax=uncultured Psychroserpens sp. TaxID=255436 RepID=UPI00262B8C3A|nr:aminotransferase class IV [uncultured Psychroserpens sp.]